jgi:hypothetical protein
MDSTSYPVLLSDEETIGKIVTVPCPCCELLILMVEESRMECCGGRSWRADHNECCEVRLLTHRIACQLAGSDAPLRLPRDGEDSGGGARELEAMRDAVTGRLGELSVRTP